MLPCNAEILPMYWVIIIMNQVDFDVKASLPIAVLGVVTGQDPTWKVPESK